MHSRRPRWQIEHVALAQQRFGAVGVENGSRIHLGRHPERNPRRKVRLDQPRNHIHGRTLRCQHQVNAHRARHLRQPRDRLFHVTRIEHHQVGQFVDDDYDVGKGRVVGVFFKQAGRAPVVKQPVVLVDIAHALGSQKLQSAFHLAHRIAQRIRRQLWFGDDRCMQMRHAFVVAQLQPLRIH